MVVRTSLLIEPELLKKIKSIAFLEKRSVSQQVNKIIVDWLNGEENNS
jgi:hypothetical protein